MKVSGKREFLQSNMDSYLKIVSTSKFKTVEDLRKYYFGKFLEEEKENLDSVYLSKLESGEFITSEQEESELDIIDSVIDDANEFDTQETTDFFGAEDTGISSNASAQSFLSAVKERKSTTTEEYVEHGVILDDIISASGERQGIESEIEDIIEIHGTYLEDLVEEVSKEYAEHGVFLEDLEVESSNDFENDESDDGIEEEYEEEYEGLEEENDGLEEEFVEESDDGLEEDVESFEEEYEEEFNEDLEVYTDDDMEEGYDEDSEVYSDDGIEEEYDDDLEENQGILEEPLEDFAKGSEWYDDSEEQDNIEEVPVVKENEEVIKTEVETKQPEQKEDIEVPKDIRQFIRKHPGATIGFVSNYYPVKEIKTQIKRGRIYSKGNKLFI